MPRVRELTAVMSYTCKSNIKGGILKSIMLIMSCFYTAVMDGQKVTNTLWKF